MARKTLGKMEFESLVKSLQEQNKGHIAAQQETTKSIRNLQTYFIKQDRADMRRRLEQGLEEKREAQKVVGGSSKGKGLSKIPTKGLLGRFMDFILTGALGTAGKGIFKSMWSGVKFGGGFFKGLAGLMGGLILAPTIWDSLTKGFESYEKDGDIADAIDKSISYFFDKAGFFGAVGAGAIAGLTFGGPKGAIAGALVFGALSGVKSILGEEKTLGDFFTGNVGVFEGGLAGAGIGAIAGFTYGARFGLKVGAKTIGIGAKLGLVGAAGNPVGMIAGALLGADIGLALGSLMTDESKQEAALKKMGKSGKELMELENIAPEDRTEQQKSRINALRKEMDVSYAEVGGEENALARAHTKVLAEEGRLSAGEEQPLQQYFSMKTHKKLLDDFNSIFGTNAKKLGDLFATEQSNAIDMPLIAKRDLKVQSGPNKFETIKAGDSLDSFAHISQVMTQNGEMRNLGVMLQKTIGNLASVFTDGLVMGDDISDLKVRQGYLDLESLARGYGAFTRPQLIQVGDQPKSQGQELVFTEKKFNQIISDIIDNNRLKQERDAMMAMIPAMTSQGGGGTSMPVINNSYSYQNTENTVREMPTTSSLNMMTALA